MHNNSKHKPECSSDDLMKECSLKKLHPLKLKCIQNERVAIIEKDMCLPSAICEALQCKNILVYYAITFLRNNKTNNLYVDIEKLYSKFYGMLLGRGITFVNILWLKL